MLRAFISPISSLWLHTQQLYRKRTLQYHFMLKIHPLRVQSMWPRHFGCLRLRSLYTQQFWGAHFYITSVFICVISAASGFCHLSGVTSTTQYYSYAVGPFFTRNMRLRLINALAGFTGVIGVPLTLMDEHLFLTEYRHFLSYALVRRKIITVTPYITWYTLIFWNSGQNSLPTCKPPPFFVMVTFFKTLIYLPRRTYNIVPKAKIVWLGLDMSCCFSWTKPFVHFFPFVPTQFLFELAAKWM